MPGAETIDRCKDSQGRLYHDYRQEKSLHEPPHGTTPNSSQAIQARVPLLLAVQGKLGTLQELTAQMKK